MMTLGQVDYAKLYHRRSRHHARFARYVEQHGVSCQACRGRGGHVEPVLDFGEGPWEECGWCEGTGKVTRWVRGLWLRYRKNETRAPR